MDTKEQLQTCSNIGCSSEKELKLCICGKISYCGVDCQKSHWKIHRPSCPPFILKDIPGKGKGLVATRKLALGTIILNEEPLMAFQYGEHEGDTIICSKVVAAFNQLSDENKKK